MTAQCSSPTRRALARCACLLLSMMLIMPRILVADGTGEQSAPKQVEVLGTQLLHLHSSIVGQDYDLYISIPRNYGDTTRKFPVFYLLDGQWDFPLVNGLYGGQYYDGFVPDVIIVGITWGGDHPNYDSLRTRDYTPTTIAPVPYSGNALKFLAFIKRELIPFIASKYRVDETDRGLMGSSLGGIFTLYAMFQETDLFTRYILTSPSIMWDNGVGFRLEEEYHAKHSRLPVKLFMAISGLEGADTPFGRFIDRLKSRNYEGLQMETRILEGMGHSGSKPEGFVRGLQWVFARPTRVVEDSRLAGAVGRYRLNPQVVVNIVAENGRLFLVTPDSMRVVLQAESENELYVKGMYLFIHLQRDSAGKVIGARVELFQGGLDLKKED